MGNNSIHPCINSIKEFCLYKFKMFIYLVQEKWVKIYVGLLQKISQCMAVHISLPKNHRGQKYKKKIKFTVYPVFSWWPNFLFFRDHFKIANNWICSNYILYYFLSQKPTDANQKCCSFSPYSQILWHAKKKKQIYRIIFYR